jgi:hypothetical protein
MFDTSMRAFKRYCAHCLDFAKVRPLDSILESKGSTLSALR